MVKYRCLVVDDEPIARDIVAKYCEMLPYLEVAGFCSNAIEAKLTLQQQHIDILFLDINMPVIDGISFLKTLKTPPAVIFTTAYKEFGVDAFDLSAVDYLLKPFSLDRFIVAVDKALEKASARSSQSTTQEEKGEDFLFIRSDGKIFKIMHADLLYAEASGNYTRIVTSQQVLTPAMTFSTAEQLLPASLFVRVHRSFIINKSRISHIEGNRVFVGKTEIPIGSNYKESLLKAIGLA